MREVVRKVLDGDKDAFAEIVTANQNRIFRYINKMISDVETAEDLCQEVMLIAYYKLDKYDESYALSTWLFKIAYNLTMNYMKKHRRELSRLKSMESDVNGSYMIHSTGSQNFNERIEQALESLSSKEKNLLILKSVEELTYKELSKIYGLKESTLRKRYERCRKKFVECYQGEDGVSLCQN